MYRKLISFNINYTTKYLVALAKDQKRKGKASEDILELISKKRRTHSAMKAVMESELYYRIKSRILEIMFEPKIRIIDIQSLYKDYASPNIINSVLIDLLESDLYLTKKNEIQFFILEIKKDEAINLYKRYLECNTEYLSRYESILPKLYKDGQLQKILTYTSKIIRKYLLKNDETLYPKLERVFYRLLPLIPITKTASFLNQLNKYDRNHKVSADKVQQLNVLISSTKENSTVSNGFLSNGNGIEPLQELSEKIKYLFFLEHQAEQLPVKILFQQLQNILIAFTNDQDINEQIKNLVKHKFLTDSEFSKELFIFIKNHLFHNDNQDEINSSHNNCLLILTALQDIFPNMDEQQQSFIITKMLEVLTEENINEYPKIISSLILIIGNYSRVDYANHLLALLDQGSPKIRQSIINTYSNPNEEEIDLMIKFMQTNGSVMVGQGIIDILRTIDKKAINILYKWIRQKPIDIRLEYWRAIPQIALILLGNQSAESKRVTPFFEWSDSFLQKTHPPKYTEPDVISLVRSLEIKYPGVEILSILRQTRHANTHQKRNVYVVTCLFPSDLSINEKTLDVCFMKEKLQDHLMPQFEEEGIELLEHFGITGNPVTSVVEDGKNAFFFRKFIDGFDLQHVDVLYDVMMDYEPLEVLSRFSYEMGKTAVQDDLLNKIDFGEQNTIVSINKIDKKLHIELNQIDLSFIFLLEEKYNSLGTGSDIYSYYLSRVLVFLDEMMMDEKEKEFVVSKFWEGLMDQYSVIHGRHQVINRNKDITKLPNFIQNTHQRLSNTGENFLQIVWDSLVNTERKMVRAWQEDKNLANIMHIEYPISKKNNAPQRQDIDWITLQNLFEKELGDLKGKNVQDILMNLRLVTLDLKSQYGYDLRFRLKRFSITPIKEIMQSLKNHNIEQKDVENLIDYIRENFIVFFSNPSTDILMLLKNKPWKE